jgi:hypothetical protein
MYHRLSLEVRQGFKEAFGQFLGMAWIRDGHFRSPAHGRGGDDKVLKPPQLVEDHDLHDDARNEAAAISDDGQEHHEPGNGRPALKSGGAGGLARRPPFLGGKELDGAGDDIFARKRRLFVQNEVGHIIFLSIVCFASSKQCLLRSDCEGHFRNLLLKCKKYFAPLYDISLWAENLNILVTPTARGFTISARKGG